MKQINGSAVFSVSLQWNMAFVCHESVARQQPWWRISFMVVGGLKTKLNNPLMIVRLDSGYLKGETINQLLKRQLQSSRSIFAIN